MKKLNLLILVMVIISCNQLPKDEFSISGTIKGVEDGHTILLEKIDMEGNKIDVLDSVKLKNGKFEFKGKLTEDISLAYITPKDMMERSLFFLENGKIKFTIDKDSMMNGKIGGSFNNKKLQEYNDMSRDAYKEMMDFQKNAQQEYFAAMQSQDEVAMNKIQEESKKISKKIEDVNFKFIEANKDAYLSLLMIDNLTNQPEADMDRFKKMYAALDKKLKDTKLGKTVSEKLEKAGQINIGEVVPDFSGPSPDGTELTLSQEIGTVTIIDFWASWCGPCRKENPEVVKLYNDYKDKGLQIVGVSLDKAGDDKKWKDAIKADNLTWPQISNLKGWEDPIAKKYNITSIPATFIIDNQGILIAMNLRGAELRQKISELLD